MKTQVIQLDPHDDAVSVRDKMGWGGAERVLLALPAQGAVFQRKLDLLLVQRHSQALGLPLALVAKDELVLAHARELGIPCFESAVQAQQKRWRRPRRRRPAHSLLPQAGAASLTANARLAEVRQARETGRVAPPPPSSAARWAAFLASLLAVLALLGALAPSAQIDVQPRQGQQSLLLTVVADPQLSQAGASGMLPARYQSITVEARASLTTTGGILIPQQAAAAQVRFTNLITAPVFVPAGLVVTTLDNPPIRFATLTTGTVPAGAGSSAGFTVQALEPGRQGNVGAMTLRAIQGPLGLQLAVHNPGPASGGSSRLAPAPNDADRRTLYERLSTQLLAQAQREMLQTWQANPLSAAYPITPTLRLVKVVEAAYIPADSAPAGRLELTLRMEFEALTVAGADLQRLALSTLDASLDPAQEALPASLALGLLPGGRSTPTASGGRWLCQFSAVRATQARLSASEIAGAARGLPAASAAAQLAAQFDLAALPLIQLWPQGWPWLPWVPARIQVHGAP